MEKTLKEIELELEALHETKEDLDKKIIYLINLRQKLQDRDAEKFIKNIPTDLSKITPKQWQWILEAGHHINSMKRHKFCTDLIQKMGFSTSGFWQETSQTALYISQYGFDTEKVKEGFRLLKKHLKSAEVKSHQSTEVGVRIAVHGLEMDETPILYVHEKGDVVLYRTRHSEPVKFPNFPKFADWYATAEKKG